MTKLVEPGTRAALSSTQTTAFQNLPKSEIDIGVIQPATRGDDEQGVLPSSSVVKTQLSLYGAIDYGRFCHG
jgi:hypothetical protein